MVKLKKIKDKDTLKTMNEKRFINFKTLSIRLIALFWSARIESRGQGSLNIVIKC